MHASVNIWSELIKDLAIRRGGLERAADPLSPLGDRGLDIAGVIRKYFVVLQTLPEKEFDLALRDLYWAALLEQSRSKTQTFPIDAESATLFEADLSNLTFKGAHFRHADFQYTDLTNSSLTNADLSGCKLQGAVLAHANLSRAKLVDANLQDASLVEARLRNANLTGADFQGAKLREADLRGATCREANFSFADLSLADLEGADLSDTTSNALTVWPERYRREPNERTSLLDGPSSASEQEIAALLQKEIKKHVPRVSEDDIEWAASHILKSVIAVETGLSLDAGRARRARELLRLRRSSYARGQDSVIRFIKKARTDRLVSYGHSVKRDLVKNSVGVSFHQAIRIVNVAARLISRYEIRVITNPRRPAASKKNSRHSSLDAKF